MFRFPFGKKKEEKAEIVYDPALYEPVLRCSICNGEQVAGFRNRETKQFTEICLIHNEAELENFLHRYGLSEIRKEY
jgi:hypothetical protein